MASLLTLYSNVDSEKSDSVRLLKNGGSFFAISKCLCFFEVSVRD